MGVVNYSSLPIQNAPYCWLQAFLYRSVQFLSAASATPSIHNYVLAKPLPIRVCTCAAVNQIHCDVVYYETTSSFCYMVYEKAV